MATRVKYRYERDILTWNATVISFNNFVEAIDLSRPPMSSHNERKRRAGRNRIVMIIHKISLTKYIENNIGINIRLTKVQFVSIRF
jgi:hypothetical protein